VPLEPWVILAGMIRHAAAALLLPLAACSSPTRVQQLTKTAEIPPRIAVLPANGTDLSEELMAMLRVQIGNAFELRGYVKFDDGWVDQRLALAGFRPWERSWLQIDEVMNMFGIANGIDGLVFLEDFTAGSLSTGVYNERSLQGRLRVLDTRQAQSTWIFDVGANESGGALLQSGQIFDAVASTIGDDYRVEYGRLAALLALAAAERLPANPHPPEISPRPQLASLRAVGDRAANTVEVTADGSPGCRAFASLPGCTGRYPLTEERAGHYCGTLPVPSDSPAVIAVLRDRVGSTSRSMTAQVAAGERP